jgi:undecaprenyl-diphosphatase
MPSPEAGSAGDRLRLGEALALGTLHGPAELLPISSSGHTELIPWLLGFSYPRLEPELRKAFEVALHAGTAAALLLALRDELTAALAPSRLALIALASAPPAAAGLALERPIERRLGTPAATAAGLLAGSAWLLWSDGAPQERGEAELTVPDALWLGVGQCAALLPGVSRNGATLAVARARGFRRIDANRLSRQTALPVIAGASALKGLRLRRRPPAPEATRFLAVGAAAAFLSTLASRRLLGLVERDASLAPVAAYRSALAVLALTRDARPRCSGQSIA